MRTFKPLNHLLVIYCVLTVSFILGGIRTASAFTQSTQGLAYACWINNFFYTNSADGGAVFRDQQGTTNTTSFWQGAEMIEVVEDAVQAGLDTTNRMMQLLQSYTTDNSTNWSWNTYNDDIMWACRAYNRAYELTGNRTYLNIAQFNWNIAFNRGWDYAGGGGLFQDTGAGASKCTCANAPAADAAFMLYTNLNGITSTNTYYLTQAKLIYNWMVTNDYVASTGGVEEGPGNPGVYFTYDQGTFATIATWLGDTTRADAVVDYVQNTWGTNMQSFGTGSDAGGFNGICLRGLAITGYNIPFLQACCDNAWNCRNAQGLTSVNFGSPTPNGTQLYCWDCSDGVAGMLCSPPAPASLVSGNIYQLAPQNATGSRLDVTGGGGSGTDMDLWQSNNGYNQQFQVVADSNGEEGVYQLVPQNATSCCLDVYGDETSPGTRVDIYSNDNYINQQWRIIPVDEANLVYELEPLNAPGGWYGALRLDVEGDGTANGTAIDVWPNDSFPWIPDSGLNQQWQFQAY